MSRSIVNLNSWTARGRKKAARAAFFRSTEPSGRRVSGHLARVGRMAAGRSAFKTTEPLRVPPYGAAPVAPAGASVRVARGAGDPDRPALRGHGRRIAGGGHRLCTLSSAIIAAVAHRGRRVEVAEAPLTRLIARQQSVPVFGWSELYLEEPPQPAGRWPQADPPSRWRNRFAFRPTALMDSRAQKRRLAPPSSVPQSPRSAAAAHATQGVGDEGNEADGNGHPDGGVGLGPQGRVTHGNNLKSDGWAVSLVRVASWTMGCGGRSGKIRTPKPGRLPTIHIMGAGRAKLKSLFPTITIRY